MVLYPEQRTKMDDNEDTLFYSVPRFVTHVDDTFIATLTQIYRDRLHSGMRILDLMSSWVSHLPNEMTFAQVEGHGLNDTELARNPRFDHYFIQNLNQNLQLPLPDQSFDAVLNAVSVQYLQYPEAIFSEIHRVLKPGGIAIVSFSNRMFFQKAIQLWRESSEPQRIDLVQHYFAAVPGFSHPETIYQIPPKSLAPFQFWGANQDPFYAVIATRLHPPTDLTEPPTLNL